MEDNGAVLPRGSLAEQYLPNAQFREVHRCRVSADAAHVIAAAAAYEPADDAFFRWAIGLREAPMRLLGSLTRSSAKRRAAFGMRDFTVLEQCDDGLAFGLIGRFWRLDYGLRAFATAQDFIAFSDPEAAKLVLSFSVTDCGDGRSWLETETRVFCPTRVTNRKFLPYWLVIRPVSGLIRRRMLASIARASKGTRLKRADR